MPLSARPAAGAVIMTLTGTLAPAGTMTVGEENTTEAKAAWKDGANVFGPVARPGACERVYVTAADPLLVMVSVRVAGPASLSPSVSLAGSTSVVARIAPGTSSIPAPCR